LSGGKLISRVPGAKPRKVKDYSDDARKPKIAQDCVVELAGLEPAHEQLCMAMDEALRDAASEREAQHLMLA
jgi:hypothetical protein